MKDSSNRKYIKIRGANEHNLKNVSLDIPRDEFVVLTGLSGSGKSSLAFDTIYRGGPAAVYGVPVLLRETVPGADGESRMWRSIEGLSPGYFH